MTTVTENDVKEIKDLILALHEENKQQLTAFREETERRFTSIESRLLVIETRLEEWRPAMQKTADLAEKVGELKKWKQTGLIILTAFVSSIFSSIIGGVIGWLLRSPRFTP